MTKDEALTLALEALEANQPINYCMNNKGEKFPMMQEDPFRFERNTKAITAIKEAMAQPWRGLTKKEIDSALSKYKSWYEFAAHLENILKEKNQ